LFVCLHSTQVNINLTQYSLFHSNNLKVVHTELVLHTNPKKIMCIDSGKKKNWEIELVRIEI